MINSHPSNRAFSRFKEAIQNYNGALSPTPDFLLSSHTYAKHNGTVVKLEEFYIPFDYLNKDAKLVVIGLTPGKTQWVEAVKAAQQALNAGCADEEVLLQAKLTGAFAKKIRSNLLGMMKVVGFDRLLGIDDLTTLFDENAHLVHWTSTFVNPILADSENFNGVQVPIKLTNPFFGDSFRLGIERELAACPRAYLLPLGKEPNKLFSQLVQDGRIDRNRVLLGMPHPSGASAERVNCWLGTKTTGFSSKTNPNDILRARDAMATQITTLLGD